MGCYCSQCLVASCCIFQVKLDKQASSLRSSGAPYHHFLNRMDQWLVTHAKRAIKLFRTFDEDGEGFLNYDEFKSGQCIDLIVLLTCFYSYLGCFNVSMGFCGRTTACIVGNQFMTA